MSKQLLPIPEFKNEDEEFEFWATHDTTDYVDWSAAERASFPNLKLTEGIDLRLRQLLVVHEIEKLALARHTSKEALILKFLSEGLRNEQAGL